MATLDKTGLDLSPLAEKNIFELFLDEVPKHLNPQTVLNTGPFLEDNVKRKLLEDFKKNHTNTARQLSFLLQKIFAGQCQVNRGLLVRIAASFNNEFRDRILFLNVHDRLLFFERIAPKMSHLVKLLDVPQIMEKAPELISEKDAAKLDTFIKRKMNAFATRYFLQCLPLHCKDWYRKFMNAVPDNISKEIDPNFIIITDDDAEAGSVVFVPVDATLDNQYLIGTQADWRKLPPPPARDMQRLRDLSELESTLELQSDEMGGTAQEMILREYQKELAEPSLAGHNVIVCARTGSGKTLVAIKVIKEHLDSNSRKAKVAFVVPSVPLVNQQRDMCRKYLKDKYLVRGIAGSAAGGDQGPRDIMVQQCSVVVMTPMILVHLLKGKDQCVKLADFSLLVLDECHHTAKDHPYTKVMTEYIDVKRSIVGEERYKNLPLVLGLTASLGVADARNVDDALGHLILMASNLDAAVVKTVTENVEEFDEYNPKPDDELIPVDLHQGSSAQNFLHIVGECMKEIEDKHLRPFLIRMARRPEGQGFLDGLADVPVQHRDQATYQSWLYLLIKRAKTLKDTNEKTQVMSWLRNLAAYHSALELNEHLPTKSAIKYLLKEMGEVVLKRMTDHNETCYGIYQKHLPKIENCCANSAKEGNGLFDELSKILKEEYSKEKPGLTIVFARTRNIVLNLANFIQEIQEELGCKAAHITSVSSHRDVGGMTFNEQETVLKRFRSKEIQVLVGTKVIAEGLDIPQCALVIKYNHVGNEKDLIQIRGRGRAVGSRSILIARKNWILEKEMNNKNKEILMEKALKAMQNLQTFNRQVEIVQKNAYETRKLAKLHINELREKLKDRKYKILCADCDAYLCDSTSIRLIHNHRVSVDVSVWKRVQFMSYSQEYMQTQSFGTICFAAKLLCPKCDRAVGQICRYDHTFYPVFKADSIVLQDLRKIKEVPMKQWSKIEKSYFYAPEIEDDEKLAVKKHFSENIPKEFEEIMKLIEKATAEDKIKCDKKDEEIRESLVGEELDDDLVAMTEDNSDTARTDENDLCKMQTNEFI